METLVLAMGRAGFVILVLIVLCSAAGGSYAVSLKEVFYNNTSVIVNDSLNLIGKLRPLDPDTDREEYEAARESAKVRFRELLKAFSLEETKNKNEWVKDAFTKLNSSILQMEGVYGFKTIRVVNGSAGERHLKNFILVKGNVNKLEGLWNDYLEGKSDEAIVLEESNKTKAGEKKLEEDLELEDSNSIDESVDINITEGGENESFEEVDEPVGEVLSAEKEIPSREPRGILARLYFWIKRILGF